MQLRQLVTIAAGSVVLASSLAMPASADPACQSGQVCFYRNGSLISRDQPQSPNVCSTGGFGGTWDMVRNYSSVSQWSYRGSGCSEDPKLIRPGTTESGFSGHYSYSGG